MGSQDDNKDNSDTQVVDTTVLLRREKPRERFALPTLRVVAGPNMLRFCSLYPSERILIGRDETCDLPLNDASISRQHAAVNSSPEHKLVLQDLSSTNGTRLNGRDVVGAVPLQVGDHIEVGSVTMRVDKMGLDELAHLARVVERLNLASKDPLTGLTVRRYLDEDLPILAKRLTENNTPLAAVFIDIDHFKKVNDVFGHAVGDEVLRTVARLSVMAVRDSDIVVRYGGEEFIGILPNCDEMGGYLMSERVRKAVQKHDWAAHGVEGRDVTVSLGVAEYQPEEPLTEWIDRADQALYRAKHQGRNRTMAFSAIPANIKR
ncbi:MAG: GGDEF domain-containing protein [Proteobacteria bacterium]|jgi:two-component system, cell cycle response regulator|nr:GGDEF domain-containing protein [Pseudomonadota bacterium]